MFLHGLEELSKVADLIVLLPKDCPYQAETFMKVISVNPRWMRFWIEISFPLHILKLKPKAVLSLGWTLPYLKPKAKYVLLLADIGPMENLGFAMSSYEKANRKWLGKRPKQADLILTLAAWTKNRIVELLKIDANKIKVVHPISSQFSMTNLIPDQYSGLSSADPKIPNANSKPFPNPFRVHSLVPNSATPYLLAMGNIEPRKNFISLIQAYGILKNKFSDLPPLFIIGEKAWGFANAEAEVNRLGLGKKVFFTGYLSQADRDKYLRHCLIFISSTLYEGWGYPLFEALSYCRPCIYHGGTSQDEFARDLAIATDCSKGAGLAMAMEKLWQDPKERERLQKLIEEQFPKILEYDLPKALKDVIEPILSDF